MNKIDHKEVPGCFLHCINTDCPMAEHCLRQIAMQALPKDAIGVSIVNPQRITPSENCEFYRTDEPQVYARGFVKMKQEMLPRQYNEFMYRLIGKFGRTGYFERRRGERLCSPKEIVEVEATLKDLGLEHLAFDAYEKHYNWYD